MSLLPPGCPTACHIDGRTPAASVSRSVAVLRLARLALHLLYGVLAVSVLVTLPQRVQDRFLRRWYAGVLRLCRVRLVVTGPRTTFAAPGRAALVVANHVSWLDVVVLNAVQPLQLVSKAEVRGWPLVGRLAARLGTVFLDRSSYDDLRVVRRVVGLRLRRGAVIGAFPEGTTTCGRGLGELRPALFQAAADAGADVRPVALSYLDEHGQVTTTPAFVGDMTLLQSVRAVLALRGTTVLVQIRPAVVGTQVRPMHDRRALAAAASASIGSALRGGAVATAKQHRHADCRASVERVRPVAVPTPLQPTA